MNNFIPTITGHSYEGGVLVLETLDPREETDLVSRDRNADGCSLKRRADLLTEEQQDKLSLQ